MIAKDEEEKFENNLLISEYIASFMNPEAVAKIRAERDAKKDKRFMADEDFETMIKNKEFLKVDYAPNNSANVSQLNTERKGARDIRLPKELSSILKLNRDNF